MLFKMSHQVIKKSQACIYFPLWHSDYMTVLFLQDNEGMFYIAPARKQKH